MFTQKKILAFALLFAVAAPLLFFTCFFAKQKWIEHEMEEQLENASLKTITVDIGAIQWVKQNKEVVIAGKLFDIRSFTIAAGKITLTGLYDKDEDILNEQMKNFVQQKNGPNTPLSQVVFNLLFPPLYNNNADTFGQHPWRLITHYFTPYREEKILSKYLSIISPPPKFA